MKKDYAIYKKFLIEGLKELSDHDFQRRIWTNQDNPKGLVCSFTEADIRVFDDAVVGHALRDGSIIYDKQVTHALQELHDATAIVDDDRTAVEIINDPLMEVVRQKAAKVLDLITASDGSESTVEIVE